MARVGSLFGQPSGKIAQLVFATWKGIGYARQYVIPGNPNSTAQQAQRLAFANLVKMGKAILGGAIQVFVDPFVQGVSGFAFFIGYNRKNAAVPLNYSLVKIAFGTLEPTYFSNASYAGSTVTCTWSSVILGNGLAADKVVIVIYDTQYIVGFVNATAARSAGTVGVSVGTGRTAANLKAYMFTADSGTIPTVVSNTDYRQVT